MICWIYRATSHPNMAFIIATLEQTDGDAYRFQLYVIIIRQPYNGSQRTSCPVAASRFEAPSLLARQTEGKLQGAVLEQDAGSHSHLRLSPTRDDIPRAVRRLRNSRDPPLLNGRNVEMSIHAQSLLSYAYETRARANFWAHCASRDFTPSLVAQQEVAHHHAGRWDVPRWTAGEEEEA